MEEQLHAEFRELRRKGLKVKVWWFKARAKAILSTTHPNNTFKYSEGWFTRFKKRYKISLRRSTNKAQKHPETKEDDIRKVQISSEGDGQKEEKFQLCQIANMDQTPLPFSFTSGPT